jgi:acetylornithine/N-succinyldiaminopimelate aminotransferase
VLASMMERHILINRTHETVLRFLPPFLITHDHVDQTIAALKEVLALNAPFDSPRNSLLAGEFIHG